MSLVADPEAEAFRRAFEDAPIGIALMSVAPATKGRFVRANQALCTVLGYSEEEILDSDFTSIMHPDDIENDLEMMDQLCDGSVPQYQIEERLTHAEHHSLWVMVNASLVRDSSGKPLYAIRQIQDINVRKQEEGQLEYLADHDPLTGLFNRRRFARELTRHLSYARRYGGGGVLLMIDLDHLKQVNDTLGHRIGDELIKALARLLEERSRETDSVGRLGGDEFAVSLPHTTVDEAGQLVNDLLKAVRSDLGEDLCPQVSVSMSIGAVAFSDDPASSATDLQVCGDVAMYEAKSQGGDRAVVYDPEREAKGDGAGGARPVRATWAATIRESLRNDAFVLYSQPVISLATGRVVLNEILIRLPGERDEMILPGSFIYTAERFGMIQELDRWVISHALEAMARGEVTVPAINLSGESVIDPSLGEFVETKIRETGVDGRALTFEVTETAAISDLAGAGRVLANLARLGCRIALDDFGAGFGSFHHLKHLRLDFLKIDGEFVRDLVGSRTDHLFVRTMVEIAHGLGQQAVAEHVEDAGTIDRLRELGVDLAQGNHIGRPTPIRPQGQSSQALLETLLER